MCFQIDGKPVVCGYESGCFMYGGVDSPTWEPTHSLPELGKNRRMVAVQMDEGSAWITGGLGEGYDSVAETFVFTRDGIEPGKITTKKSC